MYNAVMAGNNRKVVQLLFLGYRLADVFGKKDAEAVFLTEAERCCEKGGDILEHSANHGTYILLTVACQLDTPPTKLHYDIRTNASKRMRECIPELNYFRQVIQGKAHFYGGEYTEETAAWIENEVNEYRCATVAQRKGYKNNG